MSDTISVSPLQPLTFPLFGRRLIEASAGTGKTYTIASLFIRLLLGHGQAGKTAYHSPLTVDKILVVTFTEAATAELRSRIRERIRDTRLAFIRAESSDSFCAQLIQDSTDLERDIRLLRFAELQMDEASIFTIHGFCQRMLQQNAFESGSLFQQTLLEDDKELLKQACNDFWRSHFYQLSAPLTALIYSYWPHPQALQQELLTWLSRSDLHFKPQIDNFNFEEKYEQSLKAINAVKQAWMDNVDDYMDIINYSGVDKRSYSKKNLPNWFNEVTEWASYIDFELTLPKNLFRFSQQELATKTKKGAVPAHACFDLIEALLAKDLSLKNMLLVKATAWVKQHLQQAKKQQMFLGFDDLLTGLDNALQLPENSQLAEQVRSLYPVALIDEFQDTDPVQYRIFDAIYDKESDTGLFMIGDPKQAIYSFRGADIFTYMGARNAVSAHYSLDYNYRSSPEMIDAVNGFFKHRLAPFIYEQDIPFTPVKSPLIARKKLQINNEQDQQQTALQFLHINGAHNADAYRDACALATVNEIKQILLLAQQAQAYIEDAAGKQKPIQANQIAILVRTGREAKIIREALLQENINSVYLSLKESVFSSDIAVDLLRILNACLHANNERLVRAAIACKLFALSPSEIHETFSNTLQWEEKITQFTHYQQIWQQDGILVMLQQCLHEQGVFSHLMANQQERQLTDLLHLSELLQKNSVLHEGAFALLRWFSEQITQSSQEQGEQKQRLESEKSLVQVSTLHKSKGLEYDIVFIPFAGLYQEPKSCFFHDEQQRLVYDLDAEKQNKQLAAQEQLAEDIRLLYVGLTRSVYRCYLGIGPYKSRGKSSPLLKSALGYLCFQPGEELSAGDDEQLLRLLDSIASESAEISVRSSPRPVYQEYQALLSDNQAVEPTLFTGEIENNWWVTSYSALAKNHAVAPTAPEKALAPIATEPLPNESVKNIFTFPRGAKHGTFLHELFEEISFQESSIETILPWLTERLTVQNYEEPELWAPILADWVMKILTHPLNTQTQNHLSLQLLSEKQKKVEMQFVIPMQPIQASQVNQLISYYDPLSKQAGALQFNQVQGMLKGFIDLTFEFNGQYFVMDYKSNYLGDCLADYSEQAMQAAIIEHRYDFQYQLYTLALHRLLKSRLVDYDYEKHIGGVFYTFLRGMQGEAGSGVYFCKPKFALIDALDKLFLGEQIVLPKQGELAC